MNHLSRSNSSTNLASADNDHLRRDGFHEHEVAEARPLLVKARSSRVKKEFKATPLPLLQLSILVFVRLVEPISFTQVCQWLPTFQEGLLNVPW